MKIFPKIIFILFIVSCGSSDDITDGLIEIKTLQAQKKWKYTVPITENSEFQSDLSYNLRDDPELTSIVDNITNVEIVSVDLMITRFDGISGSVEVILNRPSGELSKIFVPNIIASLNNLLNFPIDSTQKKSISDEIVATKAIQLSSTGKIQNVSPLPSFISFEIILTYSLTYES
mgnify:CR=1 FL=1